MDIRYQKKHKSGKHSKILKDNNSELCCYNPVEGNLMSLRQYSSDLDKQIHKAEEDLERLKKRGIQPEKNRKLPTCPIPRFPAVPFSDRESSLKRRPEPKVNKVEDTTDEPNAEEVMEHVEHFVKCVLIETGYSALRGFWRLKNVEHGPVSIRGVHKMIEKFELTGRLDILPSRGRKKLDISSVELVVTDFRKHDTEAVQELIDLTDRFLQCFVTFMRRNKNCPAFCNADNLWGVLETTLQEINFGGINGIYRFYVERIVKKHDILYEQCVEKFNRYETLRAEMARTVKVIQGAGRHVYGHR